MKIALALEAAASSAVSAKENHVRETRGADDLPTMLEFYRGEEQAAIVGLLPDRDAMLHAAQIGASGFGADLLAITFETFYSNLPENPVTNKRWQQHEMQAVAEEHDGRAKGWVSDALSIHVGNRAGDVAYRSLRYRLEGRRVVWEQPDDFTAMTGAKLGGVVADALTAAMQAPPIEVVMARAGIRIKDFDLKPEQARAHQDCAAVKILEATVDAEWFQVALYAVPGTVRHQIIRESLPRAHPIWRPRS